MFKWGQVLAARLILMMARMEKSKRRALGRKAIVAAVLSEKMYLLAGQSGSVVGVSDGERRCSSPPP